MLQKVIFRNFKSFVKETVVDLTPGRIEYLSDTNIHEGILKGCGFFGANASGKTNALCAITLLLDLLFKNGVIVNESLFAMFSPERKMSFDYRFLIDGHRLTYQFEADKSKGFTLERLFQDDRMLLDRTLTSAKSYITENQDYEDIEPSSLFIRSIYFNTRFNGFPTLSKWFSFLKGSIYYNPLRAFGQMVSFDPKTERELYLEPYLENNGVSDINTFLSGYGFPFQIEYTPRKKLQPLGVPSPFQMRLSVTRPGMKGIPLYMESVGNQILLSFLPILLTVAKNGGIFAIDEFSSGLHNDLEELLVSYFFQNSSNAQIIFVSHSTNLLKTSLLRPDQVYACDFDEHGSFLIKFSESKMRESQNMEKMYLSGAFGGIPEYERKGQSQ